MEVDDGHVNDETVEVDEQTTVAALLERLGFPDEGHRGRGGLGRCCRGRGWDTALTEGARSKW